MNWRMRKRNAIIQKIEEFVRKYYFNKIIRGVIISLAILIIVFLLLNVIEYYSWFDTRIRKSMFFGFIIIVTLLGIWMVIIPILKILRIGRELTYKKAAKIIGDFFPEVSDKLLNLLQLMEMNKINKQQYEVLKASIEQKKEDLRIVNFKKAVNLKKSKKLFKYLLPGVLILIILLIFSPYIITSPAQRIIDYNTTYEKPKPFTFELVNDNLKALKNEDFTVKVKVTGKVKPDVIFIEYENRKYKLKQETNILTHQLKNVAKDVRFEIKSGRVVSKKYLLKVVPKPLIIEFETFLEYPDYTRKKRKKFKNIGDLIVPEGTNIRWKIYTKNADSLIHYMEKNKALIGKSGSNVFEIKKTIINEQNYAFFVKNKNLEKNDSISYRIEVIRDAYPSINVHQYTDSTERVRRFFNGLIQDDYGFSELDFIFEIKNQNGKIYEKGTKNLMVDKNRREQTFMYQINFQEFNLLPGQEITYHFQVCDNDEVNGKKCKESKKFSYIIKTKEEIEKEINKETNDIKEEMKKNLEGIRKINKNLEEYLKKLQGGENFNWQEEKRIEELFKQQLELQKNIQNLEKRNKQKIEREEKELMKDDKILEKQKKLQELMDNVLDDETKKLMEELQRLLNEMDKSEMKEMMMKMKMSNEEMEQKLDRNINLLKKLQFEQKLNEMVNELDSLKKQQENLTKETENKSKSNEELKQAQEEIMNDFKKLEKDMEAMEKLNEELEENFEFPEGSIKNETKTNLAESLKQLKKSNNKRASQSQKNASQKMDEILNIFKQMKSAMEQQQGEDITKIRGLLENVLKVSFDQEVLMNMLLGIKEGDPKYVNILQKQNEIGEQIQLIEDSLNAIAKRNLLVKPVITKEIRKIRERTEKINENLSQRDIKKGGTKQQFIMTSLNNLALFLAESLNEMKSNMNMNNRMPGNSSCQKPGQGQQKGNESFGNMQERLNKQIEELKKQMQGEGSKGNTHKKGLSEQFARMAAEQELIRKKLQEYMDELNGQGQFDKGLKKAYEDMEKTEEEIINKIINDETIKRQKDILTRLLKSEKAHRERDKSEERKSEEAKTYEISNPNPKIEYKSGDYSEEELLRKLSPKLKEYYKEKAQKYLYEYLTEDEK